MLRKEVSLTTAEWLVIAAAAVVFIIANIIMWSIIAAKEKREKQAEISDAVPYAARNISDDSTIRQGSDALSPRRTSHFRITENIVIIHTDERI